MKIAIRKKVKCIDCQSFEENAVTSGSCGMIATITTVDKITGVEDTRHELADYYGKRNIIGTIVAKIRNPEHNIEYYKDAHKAMNWDNHCKHFQQKKIVDK